MNEESKHTFLLAKNPICHISSTCVDYAPIIVIMFFSLNVKGRGALEKADTVGYTHHTALPVDLYSKLLWPLIDTDLSEANGHFV